MMTETKEAAKEWAMSQLPREACGLVIIEKGKEVFVPCRNISELDDAFALDPVDYDKAEERGEIVRVIHSHCYSSPRPSEADKVSCEASGLPWSIISVPNGDWFDFEPSGYKAPLVGRTWSHGNLDCYSLIRDYYKEVLSIEIPDFERSFEWWLKGDDLYSQNFEKAGFYQVPLESLREHDVVLMQVKSPVINHGGIYLGEEKILHHLHRRLSCREVFGGYYLKHTVKVIRHKLCVS
jgi:proteasome lid subunit RPN8/RPN11